MLRKVLFYGLAILSLCFISILDAQAAWQWQSTGTVVQDGDPRSGSGGIVVPNPSGLAIGDDVILVVSYRYGQGVTWPTPSGWALIASNTELAAFCRKADSALVSAGSLQVNGPAAGNSMGVMLRFTGGPTNCTPHALNTKVNWAAAQDVATNALTITQPDTLVLAIGLFNWTGGEIGISSYPGGATNRVNASTTFATNKFSLLVGSLVQTAAANIPAGVIDLVTTNTATSLSIVVSIPSGDPSAAPTGVAVTPAGTSSPTTMLRVTWNVAPNAHHYRVRYKRAVDSAYTLLPTQFSALTTDITGLAVGTSYDVQVASANATESVLIWPASATQATTQQPPVAAIKFNPGHYAWVDGIVYLDNNYANKKSNILSVLDEIAVYPEVQGIQLDLTWAVLEGADAGDYSAGFQLVDDILARAALRNKRVMIDIMNYQIGYFSGPGTISFPAYLLTSTYGAVQPITTTAAYRYGGVVNIPGGVDANYGASGQINSALWETQVSDKYIAMIQAYGARFGNDLTTGCGAGQALGCGAWLEMISPLTNMSFTNTYNQYGYSKPAMITQVTRILNATRAAFPTTACRLWIDYFGSDAENAQIINAAAAADCGVGGNDVLPNEDVAADRAFNGESGFGDLRGIVPWISNVAFPELCGKEGTFTPAQLFNHAIDGKSGFLPMRPQYFTWIRNTWACTAGGPQRWDSGILPFIINSPSSGIDGAISNGLDSTRHSPATVKATYCPSGYTGGCQ